MSNKYFSNKYQPTDLTQNHKANDKEFEACGCRVKEFVVLQTRSRRRTNLAFKNFKVFRCAIHSSRNPLTRRDFVISSLYGSGWLKSHWFFPFKTQLKELLGNLSTP